MIRLALRSMTSTLTVALVTAVVALPASDAAAQPRTVLALYKSAEGDTAQDNGISNLLESSLNDLGLVVRYHDIGQGLPRVERLQDVAGIVSWFSTDEMAQPVAYLDWLVQQIEAGRKVLVFGSLGAFTDTTGQPVDWREVERVFNALGVGIDPALDQTPGKIVLSADNDPALIAFERPIDPTELHEYQRVYAAYPGSKPYLTVELEGVPDSRSHMIVVTPSGGLVLDYALTVDPTHDVAMWHLNAPAFLEDALQVAGQPRMDLSTLNGRRLWFMHIDGDGLTTPSRIRPDKSCGDILEQAVLAKYPLPVTASIIEAEVHPDYLGNPRYVALARRLLGRRLIEPASHSFTHPQDWVRGIVDFPQPGYRMSLEREIGDSLAYVQDLVPEKRVELLLGSGSCNLPPEAVSRAARRGIRVLNIDRQPIYDTEIATRTLISPATLAAGDAVQYSQRAANDYFMTKNWQKLGGYGRIIETFERTAQPRPWLPINVYVHWYSAQTAESLGALRAVMDWSMQQPIAPVWTTTYTRIVDGFRAARVTEEGEGVWRIDRNGLCRTVRFDVPADEVALDAASSQGVLGSRRWGPSLYVYLDGGERHRIVLVRGKAASTAPHLAEANCLVHRIDARDGAVWIEAEAPGTGELAVRGVDPGSVHVVTAMDDAGRPTTADVVAKADGQGVLRFAVPLGGLRQLRVRPGGAAAWWGGQLRTLALPVVLLVLAALFLVRQRLRLAAAAATARQQATAPPTERSGQLVGARR